LHPLPFSGGPVYAILFCVTYALWIVLETIGSRTKRSRDTSKARDRGSFRLIMLLLWLALGLDFALSFLLPQATILWKRTSLFFIGIALMLVGMAFRFYAMSVLGWFFTYDVAIHAGQTVIEVGPYRYIRHPSYTGLSSLSSDLVWPSGTGPGFSRFLPAWELPIQGVYAPDAAPRPIRILNGPSLRRRTQR
jgi:hypothetical protein